PARTTGHGRAVALEAVARLAAAYGRVECGARGRAIVTLPEVDPRLTQHRVHVGDVERGLPGRVEGDEPAVEIEDLDAIGAALDDALEELLAGAERAFRADALDGESDDAGHGLRGRDLLRGERVGAIVVQHELAVELSR